MTRISAGYSLQGKRLAFSMASGAKKLRATIFRGRCLTFVTTNGHRTRSWSVAELIPLTILGLVGLNYLIAAPAKPPTSKTVPERPRFAPSKPPPANKVLRARSIADCGLQIADCQLLTSDFRLPTSDF